MHLLPNGHVLYHGPGGAFIWNPATPPSPSPSPIASPDPNLLHCSGHAFLGDGRLLIAGGGLIAGRGVAKATIYAAGSWSATRDMNDRRWYPTNTTLANGDMLVLSGSMDTVADRNPLPQVRRDLLFGTVQWRNLSSAQIPQPPDPGSLPLYPWMHLAPNGQAFFSGPDPTARYLDTAGTGAWRSVPALNTGLNREDGTSVMYDDGKVLVLGGGEPVASAHILNLTAETLGPPVPNMRYPRAHANATLLPDGSVLVTGGRRNRETTCNPVDVVKEPEIWYPQSNTWNTNTLASHLNPRSYHSVGILLPDGRVVVGGGGVGFEGPTCTQPNIEIYSPPYLFQGPRPTIVSAPTEVRYGQAFTVSTPDAAAIAQVTWIRLSSVTHSFNQNQRFNRLAFSALGTSLQVSAPSDPRLSPPGHYLLFILNASGVPSVARIVRISPHVRPTNLLVDWVPGIGGNGVLEVGETVTVDPYWTNLTGNQSLSLTGSASSFSGPAGPTYTLVDGLATYGFLPPGASSSCGIVGDCHQVQILASSRPATHWDATLAEQVGEGAVAVGSQAWTLHVGGSFADVAPSHPQYVSIETLLHHGVTSGCGGSNFCPETSTTRGQAAVLLLVAMHGPGYSPPRACAGGPPMGFSDVPTTHPLCRWIEELKRRGVTSGCGNNNFCPDAALTREQAAVFLLKTLEGEGYAGPPACVPGAARRFADVPESNPFCPWIEELDRRSLAVPCAPGFYCPASPLKRGVGAEFLTRTFGLQLYGP